MNRVGFQKREGQMFNAEGKLDIFENFIIDRGLPKFKPRKTSIASKQANHLVGDDGEDGDEEMMSSDQFRSIRSRSRNVTITTSGTLTLHSGEKDAEVPLTMSQRFLLRLLAWVAPSGMTPGLVWQPQGDAPRKPEITVHEFFSCIKNTTDELEVVDGRVRGYEAALERARLTGQVALAEQLAAGIDAVRSETQLHALKLIRIVTEPTIVEFVKKSPKGLRLDWVKNYTHVIPDDVLTTKVTCDERGIFDNYVILHYDPDTKAWAETHQDAAARRDPILFGVINGRRVLYFVGEWIDEFCDLSLDQIADVLGREPTAILDSDSFQAPTEDGDDDEPDDEDP